MTNDEVRKLKEGDLVWTFNFWGNPSEYADSRCAVFEYHSDSLTEGLVCHLRHGYGTYAVRPSGVYHYQEIATYETNKLRSLNKNYNFMQDLVEAEINW